MTTTTNHATANPTLTERFRDPKFEAFVVLRTLFTVAPILFGVDKFFNLLPHTPGGDGPGDWDKYLAGWIDNLVPGTAMQAMYLVGIIEIVAGILVAVAPRFGAWVVTAWLAGIIIDLLTLSGYYDVALRDFGLLVSAVVLGRLAMAVHAEDVAHQELAKQ